MALDRLAQLSVDIIVNARRAKAQLANFRGSVNANTKSIRGLRTSIGTIGLAAGSFLLIRRAIGLVTDTVKLSIREFVILERQLINIEKIAKTGNLDKLKDVFFDISQGTRGSSFEDISGTMISASRAGVRLNDGLEELTTTALRLSQASLDITAREAAEGLAALSINLKGDIKNVDRLASGIDALSDNFITTSGEILKTSARLSGFASATNLAVEDLNALSAALLSTKLSPTIVRSSVGRILSAIAFETEKAARALSLSREEFIKFEQLVKSKPLEAIKLFINKLKELSTTEQKQALRDLGLASFRTESAIRILVNTLDNLDKAVDISTEATKSGTSLIDKYGLAANTAGTNLIELEKEWKKFVASLLNSRALLIDLKILLESFASFTGFGNADFGAGGFKIADTLEGIDKNIFKLKNMKDELIASSSQLNLINALSDTLFVNWAALGNTIKQARLNLRAIKAIELEITINLEKRKLLSEGIPKDELKVKELKLQQKNIDIEILKLKTQQQNKIERSLKIAKEVKQITQDMRKLQRGGAIDLDFGKAKKDRNKLKNESKEIENTLFEIEKKLSNLTIIRAEKIKDILNFSKLTNDQKEKTLKLEKEALDLKKKQENIVQIAREKGLADQLPKELIKLSGTDFQQKMLAFEEQVLKLKDTFKFANDETRKAINTGIELKRGELLRVNREKILSDALKKRTDRENERKKALSSFIGKFGEINNVLVKFKDILDKDFIKARPELKEALESLRAKALGDIGKETVKPEFVGLTEIWKRAVTEVAEKDNTAKESLTIFQALLALSKTDIGVAMATKAAIDRVDSTLKKGLKIKMDE